MLNIIMIKVHCYHEEEVVVMELLGRVVVAMELSQRVMVAMELLRIKETAAQRISGALW